MPPSIAQQIERQQVPSGTVAIWWLGQNSYVLQGPSTLIIIDPFFSRTRPAENFLHQASPLRADELGPDAVLCTHNHSDHTDPAFLSDLSQHWPATRFFGPPESAREMIASGVPADRVGVLQPGDEVRIAEALVQVVLSKTAEVSDVAHYGYLVQIGGGPKVYNTGDIMRGATREPALMEPLRRAAPAVALITTSPTEEEFPDFAEAALLVREIGAQVAIPAHYDCFTRRTFDPAGFAAQFPEGSAPRPVIIPYCGVYRYPESPSASETAALWEPGPPGDV